MQRGRGDGPTHRVILDVAAKGYNAFFLKLLQVPEIINEARLVVRPQT
jgi:hypothetical protein